MQYAGYAYDHDLEELPDQFYLLRERAREISGEAGWRQAMAYTAIAWLGWSNSDGKQVDNAKAATAVARVLKAS